MPKRREWSDILKRGIVAISPVYKKGIGDVTIIKLEDEEILIERNIKTVLSNIAKFFLLDLAESRRYYSEYLDKKRNIPLVYNGENIYIVVKTRQPIGKNDGAMSYVNSRYIDSVKDGVIGYHNGEKLKTYTSDRTIKRNLKDVHFILQDLEMRI